MEGAEMEEMERTQLIQEIVQELEKAEERELDFILDFLRSDGREEE